MFKHLLWFSRHPADEREAAILQKAYQRAMLALWIGIIVLSAVLGLLPEDKSLGALLIAFLLESILYVSIIAGWMLVKHEDLEFKKTAISRSPSILGYIGLIISVIAVGSGIAIASPRLIFVAIGLSSIAFAAISAYWVWRRMSEYTTHARLLAGIIFGPLAVGYLASGSSSIAKRIFCGLVVGTLTYTGAVGLAMPVLLLVATPAGYSGNFVPGVATDGYERYVLDLRDTEVAVGDVIFANEATTAEFGRIIEISGEQITIEVTDGTSHSSDPQNYEGTLVYEKTHTKTIDASTVNATVILDPPFAKWISL